MLGKGPISAPLATASQGSLRRRMDIAAISQRQDIVFRAGLRISLRGRTKPQNKKEKLYSALQCQFDSVFPSGGSQLSGPASNA